jgi:pimeloyl-ACP methyl ester carboxylesterase
MISENRQRLAELLSEVLELLREFPRPQSCSFLTSPHTKEKHLAVSGGAVRVLHHRPPVSGSAAVRRPVVFLPGWGTSPEGFLDFLDSICGRIESYYFESREKNSSRLCRSGPDAGLDMTMDLFAEDLALFLKSEGLGTGRDFVLLGTCWGSSIIAHALAEGILSAPTVLLFDPMHRLWFHPLLLRYIVPLLPLRFSVPLKAVGKRIALFGMREMVQRRRAELFIENAELWKWKRAALGVRDLDLYESVPRIKQEVFYINAVHDKIHDSSHTPKLAASTPKGRFLFLPADEKERERILALAAVEFAGTTSAESPPESLAGFEQHLTNGP